MAAVAALRAQALSLADSSAGDPGLSTRQHLQRVCDSQLSRDGQFAWDFPLSRGEKMMRLVLLFQADMERSFLEKQVLIERHWHMEKALEAVLVSPVTSPLSQQRQSARPSDAEQPRIAALGTPLQLSCDVNLADALLPEPISPSEAVVWREQPHKIEPDIVSAAPQTVGGCYDTPRSGDAAAFAENCEKAAPARRDCPRAPSEAPQIRSISLDSPWLLAGAASLAPTGLPRRQPASGPSCAELVSGLDVPLRRAASGPAPTIHILEKAAQLEAQLEHLEALLRRQASSPDANSPRGCERLKEAATALMSEALELVCQRDVPGALDVFVRAGEIVDGIGAATRPWVHDASLGAGAADAMREVPRGGVKQQGAGVLCGGCWQGLKAMLPSASRCMPVGSARSKLRPRSARERAAASMAAQRWHRQNAGVSWRSEVDTTRPECHGVI
eukprot:TRINITY_DN111534_c0_g1_i1.p1 TRINITY_DN111534_c0_g1~~TRINITY_DN111534_c0_g1_i1.p1  ORF type:complete len:445 (+),score=87.47 TRINITY_DN111534_c0_g1_i1:100-1434(+)